MAKRKADDDKATTPEAHEAPEAGSKPDDATSDASAQPDAQAPAESAASEPPASAPALSEDDEVLKARVRELTIRKDPEPPPPPPQDSEPPPPLFVAPEEPPAPRWARVTKASRCVIGGYVQVLAEGSTISELTHDIRDLFKQGVSLEPCDPPVAAPRPSAWAR